MIDLAEHDKAIKIPDTLIGRRVSVSPMQISHAEGLFNASRHESIWALLPHEPFESVKAVENWIKKALKEKSQIAFTTFNASQKIIGSTRYLDIQPEHRMLEIGWTWLNPEYWGTHANRECKYLLLQYAFETLKYNRVQFKTDIRNVRSQKSIERLGAKKEGVLRSSMLLPDGYRRDSAYYSILVEEWHGHVKSKLQTLLSTE